MTILILPGESFRLMDDFGKVDEVMFADDDDKKPCLYRKNERGEWAVWKSLISRKPKEGGP